MLPSTLLTVSASAKLDFGAQSHTPHNRCVRFVAAVTDGTHATLATRRALPLTCAGLPPAGPRQLSWRTSNPASRRFPRGPFPGSDNGLRFPSTGLLRGACHRAGRRPDPLARNDDGTAAQCRIDALVSGRCLALLLTLSRPRSGRVEGARGSGLRPRPMLRHGRVPRPLSASFSDWHLPAGASSWLRSA